MRREPQVNLRFDPRVSLLNHTRGALEQREKAGGGRRQIQLDFANLPLGLL